MSVASAVQHDMRAYYAQRAAYYERVYFKPERQADLRAIEAALPAHFAQRRVLEVACGTGWWTPHGARVALLDNRFVQTSSTPITRRDAQGNSYQLRTLDDGSVHEVLKNFPTRDEAFAAIGARARDPQWTAHTHYWVLHYTLA